MAGGGHKGPVPQKPLVILYFYYLLFYNSYDYNSDVLDLEGNTKLLLALAHHLYYTVYHKTDISVSQIYQRVLL